MSSHDVSQAPLVLLTGFDAFGGDTVNPSWLAVQALQDRVIAGHRMIAAQLPTVFGESLQVLRGLLVAHRPALVLCTGVARGRSALSIERVAINVDDARIADNRGAQPIDQAVVAGGPAAYFSTLPVKAMRQALLQAGLPAEVSQTAGTFVCNHVFYGLMHTLAHQPAAPRGGFIHLPDLPPSPGGLPLTDIVRGLGLAVQAALSLDAELNGDLRVSAGAVH